MWRKVCVDGDQALATANLRDISNAWCTRPNWSHTLDLNDLDEALCLGEEAAFVASIMRELIAGAVDAPGSHGISPQTSNLSERTSRAVRRYEASGATACADLVI